VVGEKKAGLLIVYHIHLIENMGFLKDLFCKTKAFTDLQGA